MAIIGDTSQLLLDNINKPKPKITPPVQQTQQVKPAPPVTPVTQPTVTQPTAVQQQPAIATKPAPTAQTAIQALQPAQPTPADNTQLAVQPETQKQMSYEDFIQRTSPYKPMSDEDVAAQRRRQKRESMFAAIGDGISSLANLVATTKGAPSAYNAELGLTKRYAALHDRLIAEREADKGKYYQQLERAKQLDENKAERDRAYEADRELKALHGKLLGMQIEGQGLTNEGKSIDNSNKSNKYADEHNISVARTKTEGTKQTNNIAAAERNRAQGRAALIRAAKAGSSPSRSEKEQHKGQQNTIRLADGTHYYNRELTGAMVKLAPVMASRAKAAADKYRQQGNGDRARHYSELARAINGAKTQQELLTYISENAWDFPSLDKEVRNIIGSGTQAKVAPAQKVKSTHAHAPATHNSNNLSKLRGKSI